jgi:hypothetical protein
LDNFLLSSAVPEDCPFVLTSPQSLQACEKVGVQPVDLLPSSLSDYCAAFPDLPREGVISIFREEETGREEMLARCREVRREIIREDKEEADGMIIQLRRKPPAFQPFTLEIAAPMINQKLISIFNKLPWKWKDCRLRKGSWLTLKLLEVALKQMNLMKASDLFQVMRVN